MELQDSQNLFNGCAWYTNEERHLINLLPDDMKVNATCQTNNKKQALLMFSACTPTGRYHVFLL